MSRCTSDCMRYISTSCDVKASVFLTFTCFDCSLKDGALVLVPKCMKLGKYGDSHLLFISASNSTTHSVYYSSYQS